MLDREAKLKPYRFDQLAELINDRIDNPAESGVDRYVGLEHLDAESLRITRWGKPTDVEATKLRFQPGDIIFGRRRVYLRKLAVADFEGICSAHAMVLRAKAEIVLPSFLLFLMQSDLFMERALEISVGSLSPTINWRTLASQEFLLPSIEEQRRIITALEAMETAREKFATLVQAIKKLEVSSAGMALRPETAIHGVPLAKFAAESIEKIDVKAAQSYRAAGVLNEGQGLFEKEQLSGSKTQYRQLIVLRSNQIVMRKLTAWEGSIAVVPSSFDGAVVSPEFPTMSLDVAQVVPRYLRWVFRQPWFWREMKGRCVGTALRRARLHQRELLKIRIRLPSLDSQEVVADELDCIRQQYDRAVDRLHDLSRTKKQLIRLIFGSEQGSGYWSAGKAK